MLIQPKGILMHPTKRLLLSAVAATALVSLSPFTTYAQASTESKAPATAKSAGPVAQTALEPAAIDLLKATTAKLAAAKSLGFTATVGYEYPSALGPALLYTVRYDVSLQRPDQLRIIIPGDGPASEFYFDGKRVIAYLPAEDLVAIADAPPTIEGALKQAYDRSATYFPFADLLIADPYAALADRVNLAYVIGESSQIAGVRTKMIAVANDAVFLQIWIGAEDKLPRRIRAVYREDPLRLRHDMLLSNWTVDAQMPAGTFSSDKARQGKPMQFKNPAVKSPQQ